MALCDVSCRLHDLRTLAGNAPVRRRRRIANEDTQRQLPVDVNKRQGIRTGIAGAENHPPIVDALPGQKLIQQRVRTPDELDDIYGFRDHIVFWFVDE